MFCCSWCKEAAKHVRWIRRVSRDPSHATDPEVMRAVQIRLQLLSLGGYDAAARYVPAQVRAAVVARAGGRCEKCGAPGAEVDHVAGPSSDIENLQYLCKACHAAKTDRAFFGPDGFQMPDLTEPPSGDDTIELDPVREHVLARIEVGAPALLCDDDVQWPTVWRRLKADRRQRLVDRAAELGIDESARRGMSVAELAGEIADALADDGPMTDDYDGGYGPQSYFARAMERDD